MTEYASLSKYLSKNVQVVLQVVNNKKVMAKPPRETNLYGNWCVRKGLKEKFGCQPLLHTLRYNSNTQSGRMFLNNTFRQFSCKGSPEGELF